MKVLMAWELGAGLAHSVVLSSIGQELAARGHRVSYALRNLKTAETLKISSDNPMFKAPAMSVVKNAQSAAYDYAELLLVRAYEDTERLQTTLEAWFEIFDQTKPDQIVADHAPTARLAAHIAGIPSHAVGNGFAVPPWANPLHPFQHEIGARPEQQRKLESRLDEAVNAILKQYEKPTVERAIDIFIGGSRHITTFSELDNYAARPDDNFCGPIMQIQGDNLPVWRTANATRVFVYLYAKSPLLPVVLYALNHLDAATLVYAGGRVQDSVLQVGGANTFFSDKPYDLTKLKEGGCDLVICHGGASTVVSALLQSIPVVTCPKHVEQGMVCGHLQSAGLGRKVGVNENGKINHNTVQKTILRVLEDESVHVATAAFARKYKGYKTNQGALSVADAVEQNT